MKKLMFATALVASAAAFADGPLNATSFEGYLTDGSAGAQVGNKADVPDTSGGDNRMLFFYEGDADGSYVKAFGGENLLVPQITRPLYFASATPNAKYLELSTEGGTLWRSINTITSTTVGETTTYGLGTAEAVAADGTYLDTLVQFTPTEDGGAPELTQNDKLAIWLNVDSSGATPVTNLMVQAKTYTVDVENSTLASESATYALAVSGVTIQAGEWYRLTVKAIPNLLNTTDYGKIFGFQIYIDGKLAKNIAGQTFNATELQTYEMVSSEMAAFMAEGSVFASRGALDDATLQGVGFKGSGALDDLVWTTEDPFAGGGGGDEYFVTIGDTIVPITPTPEDLAAIGLAVPGLDVNDKAAVSAVLATEIGNTGIEAWQAAFLGVEPSTNGLEQVAIKSIAFDENGKVVVTMSDAIQLKTGRGVIITLTLKGSDDLATWTTIEQVTDTKTFTAVQPGLGETKKFYKVVVNFAPPPPPNE